jgi:hypothetical protein
MDFSLRTMDMAKMNYKPEEIVLKLHPAASSSRKAYPHPDDRDI